MLPKAFFLKHKYRLDIVTYFSNLNTWEVETGGWEGQSFPQLTLSQKKAVLLLHLCYCCCCGGVCLCLSHDIRGGAMVWQLGKSGYFNQRQGQHSWLCFQTVSPNKPSSFWLLLVRYSIRERERQWSIWPFLLTGGTLTILLLFSL